MNFADHHIEEAVRVYLVLDEDGKWAIDSPTADGYPLFGYDDGPVDDECQCGEEATFVPSPRNDGSGHWEENHAEDHAACLEHARQIDLPTAWELYELLGKYLGIEKEN